MSSYGERLAAVTAERGRLCVGIDPHRGVIEAWGHEYGLAGLEAVARGMVDALGDLVAVFKPQSAFFEAHGSPGVAVLERTIADARAAGALVIVDAKRGDIGSTMAAYADAYLADGSPLAGDALTLSPYLGFGSLQPALDLAHRTGRGLYVLARTSNPEGAGVQTDVGQDGRSVAQGIVDSATEANAASGQGAVGLVIGATRENAGCDVSRFNGSILAPGIGAQGGTIQSLAEIFGPVTDRVLPSASREVLMRGPGRAELREAVARLNLR
jgi:orotidine-5'-phosphate decarboxylase